MVGDSNGQREDSRPVRPARVARKRILDEDGGSRTEDLATGSPEEAVVVAMRDGRLDESQARVLDDLMSRTHLLGFESRKVITVLVNNIALECAQEKKRDLVQQLREYLDNDDLARDLLPALSAAFATR